MSDATDTLAATFDDVLEANERYARSFTLGDLEARAERGLAIVTCFDSRIEPLAMLGLRPGDAKILRVAGGRVSDDVVNSLNLAIERLGVTRVAVIPHTECAAPNVGPETLERDIRRLVELGELPAGIVVAGMRYDVRTGRVEMVVPPNATP